MLKEEGETTKTEKTVAKEFLMKNIIKVPTISTGVSGLFCSSPRVIFEQPDLNIRIEIGTFRSQIQNAEAALLIIEMLIDDHLSKLYKK